MKLGTENRKQVVALAVLGTVAVVLLLWNLWPTTTAPLPAASTSAGNAPRPTAKRSATGKGVKAVSQRLDPTLELDLMRQTEATKYEGRGRNIFVAGSMPAPVDNGTTDHRKQEVAQIQAPPPVPPPPPINLKFFGFASKPGEPKKIFLSKGEDIFIAAEGDIVDRRYKVLRIMPVSVEIEDVLNNNKQTIPLTQG